MTHVAITIAGTDVEVIETIRRLNRVHLPSQQPAISPVAAELPAALAVAETEPAVEPVGYEPEPAAVSPVYVDWDADSARRVVVRAAGNAKRLLDVMLATPEAGISEDAAMELLATHGRGIGAIKRSLESVRRKVRPDAPPILYTASGGMLELDRSFMAAFAAGA